MLRQIADSIPWPGFQNGRLLLPLPSAWLTPDATYLQWKGVRLTVKKKFHVTLLNQALATRLRNALGEREIKRLFIEQNWSISRTGDGALLRKDKITRKGSTLCASVIEHVLLPSLTRFRESLAQATGLEVPGVPAHVTLFAGGDSRGIGLADHHALQAAQVATFRLPGIANRAAPPLQEQQRAVYRAAEYAVDALETSVHIGARCQIIDAELVRRGEDRAAVISAFNPFSARADNVGNQLRQQWLGAVLHKERLEVIEAGRSAAAQAQVPPPVPGRIPRSDISCVGAGLQVANTFTLAAGIAARCLPQTLG